MKPQHIFITAILLATPALAETVALRGGKIIPIEGPEIEVGTILIVDGRITAIGPVDQVQVPYDATVIDTKERVLFPGMVLAHAQSGLDRANESLPVMPFLDTRDAINPGSFVFEDYLRDGVTTIHVIQGHNTVIGGVGRVVRPMGLTVDQMTLRAPSAIKLSVASRPGWDSVRQRAQLREAFAELNDYLDQLAEERYAAEEKKAEREVKVPPAEARKLGRPLIRDEDLDRQHKNLYLLTQGRLSAFVHCERATDVPFAAAMAHEMGFLDRTTFVLGSECYKAAGVLAELERPVVLPPDLVHREINPATGREEEVFLPPAFAKRGVRFALLPNRGSSFAERFLWYQAARCVRAGVDRQIALEAITLAPAEILGIEDRVGSLKVGKLANVLVLTGDPLSARTHVEQVVLEGKLVYERNKDFRLRRLLEGQGPALTAEEAPPPHREEEETEPEDQQ